MASEIDDFPLLAEAAKYSAEQLMETVEYIRASEDIDLANMAHLFKMVKDARTSLKYVEDQLSRACAARMSRKKDVVEGLGTLERHTGSGRSEWDHGAIFSHLLARSRDERQLDEETGEYESEVSAFSRALREAAGISYWRMDPLRKRGLDPDDFSRKREGEPYVTLT